MTKLDAWADDLKEAIEQSIRELDKEIMTNPESNQSHKSSILVPMLPRGNAYGVYVNG